MPGGKAGWKFFPAESLCSLRSGRKQRRKGISAARTWCSFVHRRGYIAVFTRAWRKRGKCCFSAEEIPQGWYSGSVTDAARAEPWELHRDCPVTSINRDLLSAVFPSRKIFYLSLSFATPLPLLKYSPTSNRDVYEANEIHQVHPPPINGDNKRIVIREID